MRWLLLWLPLSVACVPVTETAKMGVAGLVMQAEFTCLGNCDTHNWVDDGVERDGSALVVRFIRASSRSATRKYAIRTTASRTAR